MNFSLKILMGLALAATLIGATLPAAAGEVYYRWFNERGHAVHSDRPPPNGVDYEVISTGSTLKRTVDATEGAVPAEVEPKPGNEFEPVEEDKGPEKNPEYCAIAQDNLEQLNTRARIRRRNDQGEMYFLDEEEMAQERTLAQEAIEAYCE